jgi:hypothetical protein
VGIGRMVADANYEELVKLAAKIRSPDREGMGNGG